ncbi:MAG TPA: MFS transporter [Thiobacillaceae bacterium]|nr:MFS transporter [Thiobacillaceae bacterium]HNA81044.1 MFS transporter [Thiobacillaceae bacterium]HNF87763.1 MFS transporter [Thiobacillaceae bacterium]HNH89137.1 MFS transporter [Thiobacillaceae bacterium]HNI06629.1 MFS transporter [Thiobacillaceae bacterium]
MNVPAEARLLLVARALRAFVDGFICILLPAYLLALGLGPLEVGVVSAATLLGSASLTLLLGAHGHRFHHRPLLLGAALLMAITGVLFAGLSSFWPLLLVAFVGTLNPSSGDVSVFLPLEHARLAEAAHGEARTTLFARYTLAGALFAALGSLAAGVPDLLRNLGWGQADPLRVMFLLYALAGGLVWLLYRRIPEPAPHERAAPPAALRESRGIVIRLAALFSIDAFAGGLVLNSLLALWLFQRFGLSLTAAGAFFFWAGLLSAFSQLLAPWVAKRIGLVNTMVFTHIPSSVFLILAALADSLPWALGLLLARAALSQMDVPTRSAFVMAVVTPPERTAAASFTAVPRSLAAALSPSLGGALLAAGWLAAPLVACGALKIGYDLLLWRAFRRHQAGR